MKLRVQPWNTEREINQMRFGQNQKNLMLASYFFREVNYKIIFFVMHDVFSLLSDNGSENKRRTTINLLCRNQKQVCMISNIHGAHYPFNDFSFNVEYFVCECHSKVANSPLFPDRDMIYQSEYNNPVIMPI